MLELVDVTKSFGQNTVLNKISLTIPTGEIVSILGPSGCGKTTLLNVILGLTELTSGKIIYDGEDLSQVPMKKRGFNIVFQDFALFPNLNAYKNIIYGLRNNKNASTPEEFNDLIELLNLKDHLNKRIDELSGGQKQRVALAGVLVDDVDILLFDEPLANLDPATGKTAIALIDELQKKTNNTVIIIEHRLEDVLYRHVDRIVLISDGEIVLDKSFIQGTLNNSGKVDVKNGGSEISSELNNSNICNGCPTGPAVVTVWENATLYCPNVVNGQKGEGEIIIKDGGVAYISGTNYGTITVYGELILLARS